MKVLGIGCHPDDLEIACGGTLRKYFEQGADVYMCHVANGNQGHVVIEPDPREPVGAGPRVPRAAVQAGDDGGAGARADIRADRGAARRAGGGRGRRDGRGGGCGALRPPGRHPHA